MRFSLKYYLKKRISNLSNFKNNSDSFYIGMDIGATNVRLLIYDIQKNDLYSFQKKIIKTGNALEEVDKNICSFIDRTFIDNKFNILFLKGIGIALAANFDRITGEITNWPNRQVWNKFPLKKYLETKYDNIPVVFEDDANSAALGEYLYHHDDTKNMNCVYITVSTGVGGGLILNKKLFTGEHGLAGEFGHVVIKKNGPVCTCGKKGCLQALVSGSALLKEFIKFNPHISGITTLNDVSLLVNDNKNAKQLFVNAGKILSDFCINLIQTLDITLIIFGGGVILGNNIMLEVIKDQIAKAFNDTHGQVYIKKSILNSINGALGSLFLVCPVKFDEELLQTIVKPDFI